MGRCLLSETEIAAWYTDTSDSAALRRRVLGRLRDAITFDGAFFATIDPATLLYTSAVRLNMPEDASPAFVRTEFGVDDVNQVRTLARAPVPIGWLDEVTHGERATSRRYREAMQPIGLGDELRVVLRVDAACWGVLCLHRAAANAGFDQRDVRLLARLAPSLAEGLRRAAVIDVSRDDPADHGPGVAVLASDFTVLSRTPAVQRWWDELADLDVPRRGQLPTVVRVLVEDLQANRPHTTALPSGARVRTRSGRWLALHAAYLDNANRDIAVVVEPATPAELAPLVVAAYRLTTREAQVAQRILAGLARKQIANELQISTHTVNDHIKAIYDKLDVTSAGELRLRMLSETHRAAPL